MSSEISASPRPAQVVFYNDPKFRSIAYQLLLCAVVVFLVYGAARNAIDNLARAHIASGFGFWNDTAGFDIRSCLLGWAAQHVAGGRARDHFCDHSRLRHRYIATVEQLAPREGCRR